MSWITDAAKGTELGTSIQFYQAIAAVMAAGLADNGAEALGLLVAYLDDQLPAAKKTAVTKALAGIPADALQAEFKQLKQQLVGKLPEKLQPLASQLQDLTKPVAFPLLALKDAGSAPAGVAKLSFSGDINLALEAEALAADKAKAVGVNVQAEERLLRLGIDGGLGAAISGKATLAWGSVTAGAQASLAANLDYFSVHPRARYLAAAIARTVGDLPAPGDLAAVCGPKAGKSVAAVELSIDGTFSVSGGLQAGWVIPSDSADVLGTPVNLQASVSVGVSASYAHQGKFQLQVTPFADGSARVALHQTDVDTKAGAIKLGAELSVQGLDKVVENTLSVLPDASDLLKQIGDYRDPGQLLVKALKQEVTKVAGNSEVVATLLGLTLGETDSKAIAKSLEDKLAGKLAEAINKQTDIWKGSAESLAGDIVSRLGGALGLSSASLAPLNKALNARLTEEIGKAQTKILADIEIRLSALIGNNKALLAALAPLESLGHKVQDLVKQLNTQANVVVDAVISWLQHYQKLVTDVRTLLTNMVQRKAVIAVSASSKSTETNEALFECLITGLSDNTRRLYNGLWLGRLDGMDTLLPDMIAAGEVSDVKGRYKSTFSKEKRFDVSLKLFGMGSTWAQVQLATIHVEETLQHEIVIARSEQVAAQYRSAHGVDRKAVINSAFDLAAVTDPSALPVPFSVVYTREEEDFDASESAAYFWSLEASGAALTGTQEIAQQLLSASRNRLEGKLRSASVSTSCAITAADLNVWLSRSDADIFRIAHTTLLATMNRLGIDSFWRIPLPAALAEINEKLYAGKGMDEVMHQLAAKVSSQDIREDLVGIGLATPGDFGDVNGLSGLSRALFAISHQAEGIKQGSQALRDARSFLNDVARHPKQLAASDVQQRLAQLAERCNAGFVRSAAASNATGGGTDDGFTVIPPDQKKDKGNRLPWPTLGFYVCLGKLCGLPPGGATVTYVSFDDNGKRSEQVIS